MQYDTAEINAIVLAGGINRIQLYEGYKPGYKALLPFQGKPLIQYTLDAIRKTGEVKRICIVGPVQLLKSGVLQADSYDFVSSGETLIENIYKGLKHFEHSPQALVIPSDLPLLKPETISGFLEKCRRFQSGYRANILWSMVPEDRFEGPYRKIKKGFNRFKDISVCHGNLMVITTSLLEQKKFATRMERIYNSRKSSLQAALAVGPLAGFSYLFGVQLVRALTLERYARIASAGFGVGLIPVRIDDPDIAVDIDEARDYAFITEELDRREKQTRETVRGSQTG